MHVTPIPRHQTEINLNNVLYLYFCLVYSLVPTPTPAHEYEFIIILYTGGGGNQMPIP